MILLFVVPLMGANLAKASPTTKLDRCTAQLNDAKRAANDDFLEARKEARRDFQSTKRSLTDAFNETRTQMRADIRLVQDQIEELNEQVRNGQITFEEYDRLLEPLLALLGEMWTTFGTVVREMKAQLKRDIASARKATSRTVSTARKERATAIRQARATFDACRRG